ncbi:hypothetical protein GGR57DRAFT_498484 [Xylariaceae sp. FL1272]|nr:hypothetical protein GGR57DRAFT_498484 [Xylariaceae sp. FL1272]
MGSSSSKPAADHVWKASGPVGVSQDVVDSLAHSNEVSSVQLATTTNCRQAPYSIPATKSESPPSLTDQHTPQSDTSRAQRLELLIQSRVASELQKLSTQESDAIKAAREKASQVGSDEEPKGDRKAVSAEVEKLRARLDNRKQLRPLPDYVESAKGEVVKCLMENDRRPLDCWKEVEAFREGVLRMEREWVEKVVR